MGFDRSGSTCGNLARTDAQYGGYASRKTLHPRIGSANPHADRNPYSDAHPHANGTPNAHANTDAKPHCDAHCTSDSTNATANPNGNDSDDWYSLIDNFE